VGVAVDDPVLLAHCGAVRDALVPAGEAALWKATRDRAWEQHKEEARESIILNGNVPNYVLVCV